MATVEESVETKPEVEDTKLFPLSKNFIVDTTKQLIILGALCQVLGYPEGWKSNLSRKLLWRNAILYHRKHQQKFAQMFATPTVPFNKNTGVTYINQCLSEAGVQQQLVVDPGDVGYFTGI